MRAETAGEDSRTSLARVLIGVREFFLQQAQQFQVDFIHRAVALLIYKKW